MTITSFEVAFEVGTPDLVGCSNDGSGFAGMADEPAAARLLDQVVAREQVADGGSRRPGRVRLAVGKDLE